MVATQFSSRYTLNLADYIALQFIRGSDGDRNVRISLLVCIVLVKIHALTNTIFNDARMIIFTRWNRAEEDTAKGEFGVVTFANYV